MAHWLALERIIRTLGVPPLHIFFGHLLPNAIAPAIVLVTRDVGGMVLREAAFTFIGIGCWVTLGRAPGGC